jgi:hypothetical protein
MPIRIHEPVVLADEADQSAHIAASGKPFGLRSPTESPLAHAHVPLKALMIAGFAPIV